MREGRGVFGSRKAKRHDGRQAGQRQDIDRVVMEDGHHAKGLLRAQVFEVDVRDHLAGQVAFALDAEDLVLEVHQAAAFEAQLPEAARAVEQIEVRQPRRRDAARAPCG